MPDSASERTPHEQQLDALIAEYLQAGDEGRPLDQADFIRQHPEFSVELREFFVDAGQIEKFALPPSPDPEETQPVPGSPSAPRVPGTKVPYFGDYELLEELGSGGMGVVYKARQAKLKKIVALKMIKMGQLASEQEVLRFQAEARAAAKLDHPSIVSVHEVGVHHGQHYYAMDYVGGDSLSKLHRDEPVAARRAAEIIKQMAEAMHYAHSQGIVHRDLKPANVILTAGGVPRITDFGLAKRLWSDDDSAGVTMTETGQVLGTAGYMSPEQAAGKTRLVGPPADIYALGAVLYALLTSRAPFVGESQADTILQVIQKEPVSPRVLNPSIARDLETICLKCLEKEPHRRYGTAQLLADDLGRFIEGRPVLARPISRPARAWRWCRRNAVTSSLMATSALLLMVVVVLTTVGYATQSRLARELQAENARTSQNLYFVSVRLALQEVQNRNFKAARELLERSPQEHRHWEWYWLMRLCNGYSDVHVSDGTVPVLCRAFSPDGQLMTVVSPYAGDEYKNTESELRLINVASGKEVSKYRGVALGYAPDSSRVAIASHDGAIDVMEIASGERKETFQMTLSAPYNKTTAQRFFNPCFSPDGRFLAGYEFCSNLTLWRLGSEEPFLRITLPLADLNWDLFEDGAWLLGSFHPEEMFSPDGTTLAFPSANDPTVISLWNLDTGVVRSELRGHEAPVLAIQYSADGTRLASVDKNSVARVWNTANGTMVFETYTIQGRLRFSPDSKSLVVAIEGKDGEQHRVQVHRTGDGEILWKRVLNVGQSTLHEDVIGPAAIEFSGDGSLLFVSGVSGLLRAFNARSGEDIPMIVAMANDHMPRLERSIGSNQVAIINDRRIDVLDPQRLWLGDLDWRNQRFVYSSDGAIVWSVLKSSDYVGIKALNVGTGRQFLDTKAVGHLISADGMELAGASKESTTIWSLGSRRGLTDDAPTLALPATGTPIAFSSQRRRLISEKITQSVRVSSGSGPYVSSGTTHDEPTSKEVTVWSFDERRPLLTFGLRATSGLASKPLYFIRQPDGPELASNILGVICSNDGGYLAALCGSDVHLWNCGTGRRNEVLNNAGTVNQAVFAPHGEYLASICQPKAGSSEVCVWNPANGQLLHRFSHVGVIQEVGFSANGEHLLCIGNEKCQLWSVTNGKRELLCDGTKERGTSLSPDNRWVLSKPARDEDFRLIRVADGKVVPIPGSDHCKNFAFSPDGRRLVAMARSVKDSEAELRLFDTDTGTEVCRWSIADDGGGGANYRPQFSPDGSEILVRNMRLNSGMRRTIDKATTSSQSPGGRRP